MAIFTDTFIKKVKSQDKRQEKFEGGGFGILIYPSGTKSWIYRYKIDSKKEYIIFGHYPEMTLADARKRFHDFRAIRRSGGNPKLLLEQEKNRKQTTVKSLILSWYENYVEKNLKKPLQIKQQIDADILPLLGNLPLDSLQPTDITKALDVVVKRGAPVHANRILSTLKQVFNYAVSRGAMEKNPAESIRSRDIGGLEKPRERYLTLEEIKILWQFLNGNGSNISLQVRNALKVILLTGVRTAELRLAKWEAFDFENSLWTIPPEHTKGAITVKIHLASLTKSLLLELKNSNNSPLVLAGKIDGKPLELNAIPRAISRIQQRVGIPEWTAHDLRRTFATQLGEALNVDPVVIEKCLGHKMPKIMATYNKNEMLPQRREALEKWAGLLSQLLCDHVVNLNIQLNSFEGELHINEA